MYVLLMYQTEWGVMQKAKYVGPFSNTASAEEFANTTSGWRWYIQPVMSPQEFTEENAQ